MSVLLTSEQIHALRTAQVLAFPTDTVPGLFARVDDEEAIARIFAMKKRDFKKSFMLLLPNVDAVAQYADLNAKQSDLVARYSPGQVSFLLPLKVGVHISGCLQQEYQGTVYVGVRIPSLPIAQEILSFTGVLAQTSLNLSGHATVLNSQDIPQSMLSMIDFVYPFQLSQGRPSTIVRLVGESIEIVRQGAVLVR